MKRSLGAFVLSVCAFAPLSAFAQAAAPAPGALLPETIASSLLQDNNGDGVVTIAAFGDSITRGEGDFQSPDTRTDEAADPGRREASYPLRIESYLGVPVTNLGVSGESVIEGGESRFIRTILQVHPDVVIIAEGSNDGRIPAFPGQIYRAFQKMINVAHAIGVTPVISTITPVCCGHAFLQGFLDTYNPQIRLLAAVNGIALADNDHAFRNTCDIGNCRLITRNEGLHPNIEGYDVMGESEIAALLNINLFAPDGPTLLAQAIGIPPTAVRTVPDPVPAGTP